MNKNSPNESSIPDQDEAPEVQDPIFHEPPVFHDRSPENLEKFIDFVDGFEKEDLDFEEETGKAAEVNKAGNRVLKTLRARTPHRIKYEAEVEVFKRQIGDLEGIRENLGLSRRKMGELLMVDASAWSRWVKHGAPPHIYRALSWYLELQKASKNSEPASASNAEDKTAEKGSLDHDRDARVERVVHETLLLEERLRDVSDTTRILAHQIRKQKRHIHFLLAMLALSLGLGLLALVAHYYL